jgi:hypothetical protein
MPMQRVEFFSKYLGMPTQMGRSKQQVFNYIIDRIWKKLKGWKERNLSFAGRGTLIKAVIQAIPTYIMSCFMLPKNLCHQIERMACNFWWGSNMEHKKIHWINWKKVCKNKKLGGLGFRDTWVFNEALLAKQGWRFITQPEALVTKVYKAKYFPNCDFMEAQMGNTASYTWRSICHSKWILQRGCFWTIGNGEHVNIWTDNWLPNQNGFKVWSKPQENHNYEKVNDLINFDTKQWNLPVINSIFLPFEAHQISKLPLIDINSRDELTWAGTKEGIYSVKSGYQAVMEWKNGRDNITGSNPNSNEQLWKHLWKIKTPPKYANLIWRIFHHAIPIRNKLSSKGIRCSPLCPRCNNGLETLDHVFMQCDWAKAVWFGSPMTIKFQNTSQELSLGDWLEKIIINESKEEVENIIATIYHI